MEGKFPGRTERFTPAGSEMGAVEAGKAARDCNEQLRRSREAVKRSRETLRRLDDLLRSDRTS